MTLTEAQRHADHMCDVYPADYADADNDHIGVITSIRTGRAYVEGHPLYRGKWITLPNLATSCKIHN